MKKTLKLLSILIIAIFISSLLYYDEDIRLYSVLLFMGIAILSFLLIFIFLCRKKWRGKAKTSFVITLSCIICSFINGYVYIPNDPNKKAEKETLKFIQEYNDENTNHLELTSIHTDSIGINQYIAKAQLNTPKGDTKDIILYIDIDGKANEKCFIAAYGLNNYGFNDTDIEILKLGGYFDDNRVTDYKLSQATNTDFNKEFHTTYNQYYEVLRNIAAWEVNEAINAGGDGYYQSDNLKIDLTIKNNSFFTLKNPYVLVILDDDRNKTQTFKTNTTIKEGEKEYISLNLGKVKAESFKIKVLANEVFSNAWLNDFLLSRYTWIGREFTSAAVGSLYVKDSFEKGSTDKKIIESYNLYFYIEQFNI